MSFSVSFLLAAPPRLDLADLPLFLPEAEITISYFPLHSSLSSYPPPTPITPFPTLLSAKNYLPSHSIELLVADFLPASPPELYLGSFGPLPYHILRNYQSSSTEHGIIFDEGEKQSHVRLEVTLPKLDDLPPLLPTSSKDGFEDQHHHHQWDPSSSSEHVDEEFAGAGDWTTEGAGDLQVVASSSSSHGTNAAGEPVPRLLPPRSSSKSDDEGSMNNRGIPLLFVMRDRGFGVVSSDSFLFDASSSFAADHLLSYLHTSHPQFSGKSISIERVVHQAGETTGQFFEWQSKQMLIASLRLLSRSSHLSIRRVCTSCCSLTLYLLEL